MNETQPLLGISRHPTSSAPTSSSSSSSYRLRPSHQRIRVLKVAMLVLVVGIIATILYVYAPTYHSNIKVTSFSKKSSATKPNIVFILADDMGYNSISEDVTPFMSSLAEKSITLSNYYSQETCTPARAALLTGRYPLTIGVQFYEQAAANKGGMPEGETTIADVLQDEGYTTYMMGKWNLGNASPYQLPTARGFDYYLGFLDAYNHYWSKLNPDFPDYMDFMYSDKSCYYMYDGDDVQEYSTTIFQNAAVAAIAGHDFEVSPMFLYMAVQAARAPFDDLDKDYKTGMDDTYLEDIGQSDVQKFIGKKVDGEIQKQYFKSIAVMDKAVENIYNALDDKGVLDNSYILFASDNGGCPTAGGRNYPLRGTKGSLFEGGVHVEAFIFSPLLSSKLQGSTYDNLFHVSDWFPTILSTAGIAYVRYGTYAIDGVSHYDALISDGKSPRETLLYNYYYDPSSPHENLWSGKAFAIRNDRYKLMHTYDSPMSGAWYADNQKMNFDDDMADFDGCAQFMSVRSGVFTYFLFDLKEDPTETTNLYDTSASYKAIQAELYDAMDVYATKAATYLESGFEGDAEPTWKENSNYIVPWVDLDSRRLEHSPKARKLGSTQYPANCGLWSGSSTANDADYQSQNMKATGLGKKSSVDITVEAGKNSFGLFSAVSKTAAASTVAASNNEKTSSSSSSASSTSSSSSSSSAQFSSSTTSSQRPQQLSRMGYH